MTLTTTSRLQKIIAQRGYCSRRKAEELILAGLVKVNGKTVDKLGAKFGEDCELEISGEKITASGKTTTIALNKPAGYVCSKSDPHNSQNIMRLLPPEFKHLNYAGRLDKASEGLVILSSDGGLIYKLSHPKFGHTKTYIVTVHGRPSNADLQILESGDLQLDGYKLNPMKFEICGPAKIKLILSEGRKRQIRRIMDSLGFPVIDLRRIAIGKLEMTNLESGKWKELSEKEILMAQA
ncbi:rRNA pseudouridine synthase [Candidatus Peregrinibacteria bacterium]|nr:rRNA pseudouridine synthase [Candidatus Peregrinibacteria bacterium]